MEIIELSDIQSLIDNKIQESTNLEYKDPRSLENKADISKHISAMANSNGGSIIYGLCEDSKNKIPVKIEFINDSSVKEKIEQVLQANVTPKLEINMNVITSEGGDGKFILVVNVPKSDKAPHQDHYDKGKRVYWRRNGYTTRQMEHYEVEDLFFKRKRPALEVRLELEEDTKNYYFNIDIVNEGKIFAEKLFMILKISKLFRIDGEGWNLTQSDHAIDKYEYYSQKSIPFFPGIKKNIGRVFIPKNEDMLNSFKFNFMIVCEHMALICGDIVGNMWKGNELRPEIKIVKYKSPKEYSRPFVLFD